MRTTFQPWIEKFRPDTFDKIVLDDMNRSILTSIIEKQYLPNLLFYGPPGTGKTTTIINMSKEIHAKQKVIGNGLVIHLNASDERGIDTIRSQINQFVNSSALFSKGIKIVILDEVDYMTKSAQQALKCLIDYLPSDVRFCLICNYINRIDESIRDTFVRLRFNQLPQESIIDYLENITIKENVPIDRDMLASIQVLHQSDMRSMINYIQTNHIFENTHTIITNVVWEKMLEFANEDDVLDCVIEVEETYSLGIIKLIKLFSNYIIRQHQADDSFLNAVEFILHHTCPDESHARHYFIYRLLRKKAEKLNINKSNLK